MRISVAIAAALFGIKTIARHDRDQARGDLGRSGHRVYEEHSGDDRTEGAGLRPITEENG